MAWPVTALYQTMAALDVVTHDLLNAIQTAIKNVVGGSRSVKSLWADGVGDQASALGAGEIHAAGNIQAALSVISDEKMIVSRTRSSATGGSGQSVAISEIYSDTVCFAWVLFQKDSAASTISIIRSVNVASVTYVNAGKYRVTLQTAAAHKLVPVAIPVASSANLCYIPKSTVTTSQFEVWNSAADGNTFSPADISDLDYFSVIVFAG